MFIVYSFIGKLPNYIIDSVKQMRFFYKKTIFLILDDLHSEYIDILTNEYNVKLINYRNVKNEDIMKYIDRFPINEDLYERKLLFFRSTERFFLIQNLMKKFKLQDCIFLEIDNVVYENPELWLTQLKNQKIAFMYDNVQRISTGVCYIKNYESSKIICDNMLENFNNNVFISEMEVNWDIRKEAYILPTLWENKNYNQMSYKNYKDFHKIFDSSSIGILFFEFDIFHKGWMNDHEWKSRKNPWAEIDYTKYKFVWKMENSLKIPYIINEDGENIKIVNLHIHSKNIHLALSKI